MIRYVHIGNQLCSELNQFSFYNTITESFVSLNGDFIFDNPIHFRECYKDSKCPWPLDRFLRLIPSPPPNGGKHED